MNVTLIKNGCKVTSSNNITAALVNHFKCLGFDCLPLVKCNGCDADGTADYIKDFFVPDPTMWPWFDPYDPASTEYLGVFVTGVDGLRSTTSVRDVTSTVGGSSVGLVKNSKREIVVTGVMFALSERGMAYGRRWEEARWWNTSDCEGSGSVSFRVDCSSSLNADDGLVELERVVAVAGPTYSDTKQNGQCCDMMMNYEVTLNALDTGFYTPAVIVGERTFDFDQWECEIWECDPDVHVCGPECCTSCRSVFVDYFGLDQQDCYSRPLMVTREEFLFEPTPAGVELGFNFMFSSGSAVLENTRVLFTDLDFNVFSAFESAPLRAGSVLKIDGKSGKVFIDCGYGFDRSYDFVVDAGGLPFSNKRVSFNKRFKIVIETDAGTVAEDAKVQLSVFQRSTNTILSGGMMFYQVISLPRSEAASRLLPLLPPLPPVNIVWPDNVISNEPEPDVAGVFDTSTYGNVMSRLRDTIGLGQTLTLNGDVFDTDHVSNVQVRMYYVDLVNIPHYWTGTAWTTTLTGFNLNLDVSDVVYTNWSGTVVAPTIMPPDGSTNLHVQVVAYDGISYSNIGTATVHNLVNYGTFTDMPDAVVSLGESLTYGGTAFNLAGVNYVGVVLSYWDQIDSYYWNGTAWSSTYTPFAATLDLPGSTLTDWTVNIAAPTIMPPGGITEIIAQVVTSPTLTNSNINFTAQPVRVSPVSRLVTYHGAAYSVTGVNLVQQSWVWWDGVINKFYDRVTNTWVSTRNANTSVNATLGNAGATNTTWAVTCMTPSVVPSTGTVFCDIVVGDSAAVAVYGTTSHVLT